MATTDGPHGISRLGELVLAIEEQQASVADTLSRLDEATTADIPDVRSYVAELKEALPRLQETAHVMVDELARLGAFPAGTSPTEPR
jgi:hypothetical protein